MSDTEPEELSGLLARVRACTICVEHLPHGPRPIVQIASGAPLVLIGQAPGRRVHESGVPWDDPSGETLRSWLGVGADTFYDPGAVAIMPMGFCYPGSAPSGDKPPRPECAPQWHDALRPHLAPDRLEIIIGVYAMKRYVPNRRANLTETVADWADHLPDRIVLPHPSPRNRHWLTKNPWFETETLPAVRERVAAVLDARGGPSAQATK